MFCELVHKADLGNGYYLNPILDGDYADPAVFRKGEDYYLSVSTGPYYPGLTIFHSRDLVNWNPICHPLQKFQYEAYAPDFFYYQGKYYIYFCAGGTNWVIWSKNVDNGWSEPIDLKVGYIDPGHCVDRQGNRYLFLSDGHLVPLTQDGLAVAGEVKQVIQAAPIPDEWDIEGFFPEAPNVFEKDGYYYLTYANGGTAGPATSHMIVAARAKDLYGPWEFSPYNPIVHTYHREEKWISKGHGHFVEDTEGKWWAIYHAYENGYASVGRKLLLSPVEFTEDGWFRITAPADEATKKPVGCDITKLISFSDSFSSPQASSSLSWRSWQETDYFRYEYTDFGLKIHGTSESIGKTHPLTLTTGDHSYEISVHLKAEPGCEAGLVLMYNPEIFNAVALKDGMLTVYRVSRTLAKKEIGCSECWLKMTNREQYVAFHYSLDGVHYQKLNYVIDVAAQNNNAYLGFQSLRPGIFAAGNSDAEFSDFIYIGRK
ncbi:MAG: family 43 glycosylhydrolase [Massiliimalia sp.]|jgi:xylan 1,4-beta-xylosidase